MYMYMFMKVQVGCEEIFNVCFLHTCAVDIHVLHVYKQRELALHDNDSENVEAPLSAI